MAQLKDLMVYGDAKFLANAMLDHDPTLNLEAATKHYVDQAVTGTITGSGTSGYLVKWNGSSSITNGPQLGSGTTTYLRNDGTWATPANTTYTLGTGTTTVTLTPSSGSQQSITVPYATSAGKATNDASGRAIETTYGHALSVNGNTVGLEDGNGDAISGSFITAPYATVSGKISDITSTDTAYSLATWRKVWMSYADGVTGRPAVTDALVFQTSTNTLKTTILEGKYVYVNSGAANSTTPVLIAKNKPATGGTAFVAEFDNNTESSASTTWANCLVALAPNLAASTNATYANFCALAFGKANSNANVGTLNFHYSGSSSTANWVSIGFHSHNHILNVAATERVGIKNTAPISELDVTGGISWSSKATSQYNSTDDCVEFIFV